MKKLTLALILLTICPALAQKKPKKHEPEPAPPNRSQENVHSFVELFTNLEQEVAAATETHKNSTLEQDLAGEFIFRSDTDPRRVLSRAEWLETVAKKTPMASSQISDMTVRVYPGDVALVSYLQTPKADPDGRRDSSLVVDVWVANHQTKKWQLAQRYLSMVSTR